MDWIKEPLVEVSKIYFLLQYFRSVQIVTQEPKEFCIYNVPTHKEEFKGSWKNGLNAGGLTNHYDDYFSKKFEENPQYLIKNIGSFDSKCIIALSQATKDIENRDRLSIGKICSFKSSFYQSFRLSE